MSDPRPVSLTQYFNSRSGFRGQERVAITPEPHVEEADPYSLGLADGQQMAEAAFSVERAHLHELIRSAEALRFEDNAEIAFLLDGIIREIITAVMGDVQIDSAYLKRQIEAATAMLTEADRNRTLRLNPDDLELLADADVSMPCVADPDLPRAALRIECSEGWIEHGPAYAIERLQRALSEAGEVT